MFTSAAVIELLKRLAPPSIDDFEHHPLQACFMVVLCALAASLWNTCFVHLSGLIKARLCNSSSSTWVPPMARDQAGMRKWTSKIAPTCRIGLLYLLTILQWGGWMWIWMMIICLAQDRTWLMIPLTIFVVGHVTIHIIHEKIFDRKWKAQ